MEPQSWLSPGLRWLLIWVAWLNVAGCAVMLVHWLSQRVLIAPSFPLARRPIRASALREGILFAQSVMWLAFALSRDPRRTWPILFLLAVVSCLSCFHLARTSFAASVRLLRLFGKLPDAVPNLGYWQSLQARWRLWRLKRRRPREGGR